MEDATPVSDKVAEKVPASDGLVRLGRVALATQEILYGIIGLLAVQVAFGNSQAKPSQRGALESVVRQPFGQILLVVVAVGLAAHALWRLALAARGDPGSDEDGGSLAKRAGNLGRAAIYIALTAAAVRIILQAGRSDKGGPQHSTAEVLGWPGGKWIVIAAGLGVLGAAVWNAYKAVKQSFVNNLDQSRFDESRRKLVRGVGTGGYLGRAGAFALVGWFLVKSGLDSDANKTQGLDGALRKLAVASHGRLLLLLLAAGLILFGIFRVIDGMYRKPSEITNA